MTARGIRNNNPGNIKNFGTDWRGMSEDSGDEETFVVFRGPWWGIRAMAVILRNYQKRYGLDTVEKIVNRWAPESDNNQPRRYTAFVARELGVDPWQHIDVTDYDTMRHLVQAITKFENGAEPYSWQYDAGLLLADIEPNDSR